MRPNWFIALPIQGEWLEAKVHGAPAGVRVFHPSDLHATVAFLGATDETRARRAFDRSTFDLPRTTTRLGSVVPMGDPARFSALSALLLDHRAEIEAAIGAHRIDACRLAGVEVDARPPKAHVTIARMGRRTTRPERDASIEWAQRLSLEQPITLEQVALYTWSEDRRERLFRIVDAKDLSPMLPTPGE